MWSTANSDRIDEESLPLPLEIRAIRNARRMRLRIDDARGLITLTCPPRTSRRAAVRWALGQREWIDSQLANRPPNEPFVEGAKIPVEGQEIVLVADSAAPRAGRLEDGQLRIGGPPESFARSVERHLRARALAVMSGEVAEYAQIAGVTASGVTVGDAATRWGSCSSDRRIRLSWRLILASPAVRRFVVAHEVAHLKHLDHGAAFKALEAFLAGRGLADARAALKREGPRLRRLGRGR